MVEYSPGMRVIIRDEEWMVKKVERNNLDKQSLHCVGVSPLVKDRSAIFLTDLEEIIPVNPAEIKLVPDDSQYFKRSRLYIESQWRQQIPTDTGLHIGNQAAMDPMNYQLEPAQMALRRPKQRILIADTVGLGKTLEAGILMSELIARGKGKRILVVTVKSMMMQFQKEMWNRFTIPLIRLDSKKIQDIRAKLPSNYNPFFYYDKTIVSIDTLKRDVEYRTHLENATWDIIVIDEAHNVAERGGHQAQRARLAKLLAGRSDTLIMLSATPHDGRSESFASLMNMLDPTAIADIHNYTKEDKGVRPALERLLSWSYESSEGYQYSFIVNKQYINFPGKEDIACFEPTYAIEDFYKNMLRSLGKESVICKTILNFLLSHNYLYSYDEKCCINLFPEKYAL